MRKDIPLLTDRTRSVNFEDIRSDAEIPDIGLGETRIAIFVAVMLTAYIAFLEV